VPLDWGRASAAARMWTLTVAAKMTPMPPLVFSLVIGVGSVVTVVGLVLLLAALTTPPRAQPRLRLWRRAWRLRTAAVGFPP
jgi:hypothetical protein